MYVSCFVRLLDFVVVVLVGFFFNWEGGGGLFLVFVSVICFYFVVEDKEVFFVFLQISSIKCLEK